MKKILILSNYFGIIHKFKRELVESLVQKGYEVVITLPYSDENKKIEDMRVRIITTSIDRKSINPIKDLKLILEYKRIFKLENPDITIGYTIKPNIYGGLVSRITKTPFIANITGLGMTYYNGKIIKKIVSTLYKLALKSAKSVFFENIENAQVMLDDKTIKKNQVVITNGAGVNLEKFIYSEMPSNEITKFLFIGRIMKDKGINELLDAIKRIKSEGYKAEFSFLGWFEEDYSEIIKDLQDKGIIKYYGYQDDVSKFIKQSHAIILPSYHEGMANVLLEGAAMGRALIASDIHGCKEAIVDGKSGFVCKVKDSEDLYKKIKIFINKSYNEKVDMGICGRQHMEKIFDKSEVVGLTIDEIEKALRRNR